MALRSVPPPPPLPPEPPADEYRAPKAARQKWWLLGGAILLLAVIWWGIQTGSNPVIEQPSPTPVPSAPAITLKPSLVVPGPAQQPHPALPGVDARPDEVIIFRVDVAKSGYVLLGVEGADGTLLRIYGGRPDQQEISGSELIYEDGLALAYALERHKGQSVTFVAALSSKPWTTIPERIPATPPTYPPKSGEAGAPPPEPLLAWDRFTLKVMSEVPQFETPGTQE